MPAIAEYPNSLTFRIRDELAAERRSEPQSDAGRRVLRNRTALRIQWSERGAALDAICDAGSDSPYPTSRLEPVFYAKVKYKYVGRMKYIPYPFDD